MNPAPKDDSARQPDALADTQDIAELYRRYASRIYTFVYRRVGDTADAEDLTAFTFAQALAHLPSYVDRGAPITAWLHRIAANAVANRLRERAQLSLVPLESALHVPAAVALEERLAGQALALQRLRDALPRMAEDRQRLLALKLERGLSNGEIAEILGRTEGAIKSLYFRTLAELRGLLESMGVRAEEFA